MVTSTDATDEIARRRLLARGSLSDAKRWFTHRGWKILPRGNRGRRILRWGADQAWLAAQTNPKRSVRNWCHHWDPRLSDAELRQIVADTVESNKRWTLDQSAAVLEITVRDRQIHGFRFIGAMDDPNYEIRTALKKEKGAARARRYRASHSTGAKRGRPALQLSEEDRLARKRAQGAERAKRLRASRKNASRHISNIGSVTDLSVTRVPTADHGQERRARKAPVRPSADVIDVQRAGCAMAAPPRTAQSSSRITV